ERGLPVRIQIGNTNDVMIAPVLKYYGIAPEQLESWGGRYVTRHEAMDEGVDVLINRSGSNANNEESAIWNWASWTGEWNVLTLHRTLREELVRDLGNEHVILPTGYLRGTEAPIPTVERPGQAVIGRDDMPDDFAYALARGMDL